MSETPPRRWRGGQVLIAAVVGFGALMLLARGVTSFLVEVLWFEANGYLDVFWKQTLWRWGVRGVVALGTGALVLLNVRIVASTLGGIQIRRRFGNLEISEQLPRSYVLWGSILIAAMVALWFGAAVPPGAGIGLLLLLNAPEWGMSDPFLAHDLSFYVFTLPVVTSFVAFGLILVFFLFSLVTAGYAATGTLRWVGGRVQIERVARRHLTVLTAAFLVLLAARFWVARYLLLLDGNSSVQGLFGFADAQARIPGLKGLAAIAFAAAILVFWGGFRRRLAPVVGGLAAVALATILIGQLYPAMVQRFRVEPNELDRETPFIERNLEFTRIGFGLSELQRQPFDYRPADRNTWESAPDQFAGLPVWTPSALLTTYRQLEARFRYYEFTDVAIDRYEGPEGPTPVALAVREIEPAGIEDRNWQNLHIRERYVTGMGAVASAAALRTPEGRPSNILSAIPPEFTPGAASPEGLRLTRPSVFFGTRPQTYAIINPTEEAFLDPDGLPGEPGRDYPEGILLDSSLRKLALAWRFGDANLLFAAEVMSSSRFVFQRQVTARAQEIAPFLRFPEPPYPVVHEGRIVWMIDAFTVTRHFPLSSPYELELRFPASYVRNSVKVTVDAITGRVSFYVVDEADPLLLGFRSSFPGLFRSIDDMPANLRDHIRFPRELLRLQGRVLFQYHQETSPSFHGQEDVWAQATELAQGTSPVAYRPEYGLYTLPGLDEPEFLLSTVFVPAGRQNLTAIMVARSEADHYGELILYDVAVEEQVPGPRQVEALIEQDPFISQQLSLWRQGGSQVWTGHLHLVPVAGTLLYMEPLFLAAESDAIPELRQFIVSDGRRIAMEPTLAAAVSALAVGMSPEGFEDLVTTDTRSWPREALDLLDRADEHLRAADFEGFGAALRELRGLLEQLNNGPTG